MDFMTGLPSCVNGCKAIFICVDHLTKYTVLTACTSGAGELSAKQVVQLFLQGIVRQIGLPDNMVHDRDQGFTTEFQMELLHTLGSRDIFNRTYHP